MDIMSRIEKEEKWIMHYSSSHRILLVGERDFSFSACLAKAFGSAGNMVATSLDPEEELLRKYSKASTHLKELEEHGCTIIHQVDARTMSQHPLLHHHFDRIIFNFPHATLIGREHELYQTLRHQELVKGFLENAAKMLSNNGEVHVTHKAAYPFNKWEIEELANQAGLFTHRKVYYSAGIQILCEYPGYCNKRGQGVSDDSFPLGECNTFMFKLKA